MMKRSRRGSGGRAATLAMLVALCAPVGAHAEEAIEDIVVTSTRRDQPKFEHLGNIDALSRDQIESTRHAHVHELLVRVPGVWITRASGQESLPAIRSPVLTGAGSCGAFLVMEDGIPSRPAGFCNVNQLFELNTEQARTIEVIRGPGNALYGSNALHGTVNVLMPGTDDATPAYVGLEHGANAYYRLDGFVRFPGRAPARLGAVLVDDGGFRDDSGHRQFKVFAGLDTTAVDGSLTLALSLSDLQQETAGFILGEDAYKDPALNRGNLNPEAYRDAESQRVYAVWTRAAARADIEVRPFLRRTRMTFLQHFLPGQPLEENGHVSAGALLSATVDGPSSTSVLGLDLEWADVWLRETQFGPTEGSDLLRETRPAGKHYDYDVRSMAVAPYFQAERKLSDRLTVGMGLRAEYVRYDYDNHMLSGNTRDDGTECGFGGCLYTRPASRADDYFNLAPKLGASLALGTDSMVYLNLARGFRAPQMTELYRLQSGQAVSDLEAETVDSLEVGWRALKETWQIDLSIFAMKKRDSVIRDAEGFNVSGGRSTHAGIELSVTGQLHERWSFDLDGTYARHRYDFDSVAARGETFVSGRDVDTAPRWIGSAELRFRASPALRVELQWASLGDYYLDAENRFSYPGHDLLNLRAHYEVDDRLTISARLNNVADTLYADRADHAFGNYRYFPGRGRELFVSVRYLL